MVYDTPTTIYWRPEGPSTRCFNACRCVSIHIYAHTPKEPRRILLEVLWEVAGGAEEVLERGEDDERQLNDSIPPEKG